MAVGKEPFPYRVIADEAFARSKLRCPALTMVSIPFVSAQEKYAFQLRLPVLHRFQGVKFGTATLTGRAGRALLFRCGSGISAILSERAEIVRKG